MARQSSSHTAGRRAKGSSALFGSRTDIGCVREQNEDSLIVNPPLYVVADGMGGHAAGEIASEIAVRTINELAPDHADTEALSKAVAQANRNIINAPLTGKGREGMGTTCTAAILDGTHLAIAQVGDSRAYLLHNGRLSQITRDHSLVANMVEAGQLTPDEARIHPNRSVITRALGNDPTTTPDLYEINVEEGDRLLLCTDGLSTMLEDDEIQAVMNRLPDPQQCANTLVTGALVAGGLDNVTVVIANVTGTRAQANKRMSMRTKLTAFFIVVLLALCLGGAAWGGSAYLHHTAYLAASESGTVNVYRGVPGEVLGFSYSELVEETDIPVSELPLSAAESIGSEQGMRVGSVEEALELVAEYENMLDEKNASSSDSSGAAKSAASSSSDATASAAAPAADEDDSAEPSEEGGQAQ